MRKRIIIGNWKMNMTISETKQFLTAIKLNMKSTKADVAFAVPYTALNEAKNILEGSNIKVASQNVHYEPRGAYTGEISIEMLKEIGIEYCIVGHSERRQYFNETDETVNKKVKALLENNISPVVCVGENLEERESNTYMDKIRMQVKNAIQDIDPRYVENIIIAYEPIWAIGTGKTATSAEAQEICSYIRYVVAEAYGLNVAEKIRIQYGGSVNKSNAKELFCMEDIDGALVGGASLKPDFVEIVEA